MDDNETLKRLDAILNKISYLESEIKTIKENSNLMVKHIGFIEGLYQTMRAPLNKVLMFFS